MRILMVGSEAVPYAKTGGLADVLGALPRALGRLGHEVDLVMPMYRGIQAGTPIAEVLVPVAGPHSVHVAIVATERHEGVRTCFVSYPPYFDRDFLYGTAATDYPDNPERFAFLSRAALTFASLQSPYDVVHAHDWQTGLVPVLLRELAAREGWTSTTSIFTIHNLAYQGLFEASSLARLGLPPELMHVDALEYWGRISYLKGGIVFSRLVTTVSPRYAIEIQTPEYGFGFDGILRMRSADVVGILNGIDYDQWDPARDQYLPEPFDARHLEGKAKAKQQVLAQLGLPVTSEAMRRPLVGMISRLVDQKGFDLLAAATDQLTAFDAAFAILGTGEFRHEDLFRRLAETYPDRLGVRIGFDEALAHRIEAGADMFLMPSRFEPCGLNQMYSLRYGTVPVVRATGGLYDTVQNYDPRTGAGNGFTFDDYTPGALLDAMRAALDVFPDRKAWRRIQAAGMQEDHSWDQSARQYVSVYERARNS